MPEIGSKSRLLLGEIWGDGCHKSIYGFRAFMEALTVLDPFVGVIEKCAP